ncbi:MAG TPA: ribosome small subunit-dependent GTPase A [Candidatus Gallacutalibacter stercoravium]|nr:ribosome small subunit-dependent GTPase A [Candidatus Gallacutalibacter stercoravium]
MAIEQQQNIKDSKEGIILKGVGGSYHVGTAGALLVCTARGLFRKDNKKPLPGDRVKILTDGKETHTIVEILPRKNELVRPPVANVDQLVVVTSLCDPQPNALVIDKMLALAVKNHIRPIVVFSKVDLQDGAWWFHVYQQAGFCVIPFSSVTGEGVDAVRQLLQGGITVFTGNSGVGKSSLLNCVVPQLRLETGDISKKLGRGRHTTRKVELFALEQGGYVADTPGFSLLDLERCGQIRKEELADCFTEFAPYIGKCRFSSCAHLREKGCAVLEAVQRGEISESRHRSYVAMYDEVKDWKEWEHKN